MRGSGTGHQGVLRPWISMNGIRPQSQRRQTEPQTEFDRELTRATWCNVTPVNLPDALVSLSSQVLTAIWLQTGVH